MRQKPDNRGEWRALQKHYAEIQHLHLRDLFSQDPGRAKKYSLCDGDLLFDFSKHRIIDRTIDLLLDLAKACRLEEEIERMFSGEPINESEQRPALHVALRNLDNSSLAADDRSIMAEVLAALQKMKDVSEAVRQGRWLGSSGKKIRNIVHLGIGGSLLGPRLVAEALRHLAHRQIRLHFVSNIDGNHITQTLRGLKPAETLFVVVSKTFGTEETLTNARTARDWLLSHFGSKRALARHFLAVTANTQAAVSWGFAEKNIFPFWEWVGGRFSVTSAVSLAAAIAIGFDNFAKLLFGFQSMDLHFRCAPLEKNIPVLMALLGIWYVDFFNCATQAVIPYSQDLRLLPAYLQQLEMESNGKCVDRDGRPVGYPTAPVVWGATGTDGQHAFFQLLHQGTQLVPVDFIGLATPVVRVGDHHRRLLANLLAQTDALAFGRDRAETKAEGTPDALLPFKVFPGNRPSTTIMLGELSPLTLGKLLAIYEHKVFSQGIIWNLNSFDQWGVELGKKAARGILPRLFPDAESPKPSGDSTGSSALIDFISRQQCQWD